MPKLRILFLLSILFFVVASVHAQQEYTTDSRQAEQAFKEALQQYRLREHQKALGSVNKALRADEDFIEAYILKGQIFEEQKDYRRAIDMYR